MRVLAQLTNKWRKASPELRRKIAVIFGTLFLLNVLVWLFGFSVSRLHPVFLGLISVAYGLGLRHAVDADHIAAIDNTTRKFLLDGKRPIAVGLLFSLGHSTIVIVLTLLIIFSASFVSHQLPFLQRAGSVIGTAVSSFFLILIAVINLVAFLDILRIFRCVTRGGSCRKKVTSGKLYLSGYLARILKPLMQSVSTYWHIYGIGFLFGLGFDTASEIGLLSISGASAASGITTWQILLLPLAFTAGMTLIDSLDGILMLGAYGWAYVKPMRKLYYNLTITFLSIIIALLIGSIQALQLLSRQLQLHNRLITVFSSLDMGKLGYVIIIVFFLTWCISMGIYKFKQYDRLI